MPEVNFTMKEAETGRTFQEKHVLPENVNLETAGKALALKLGLELVSTAVTNSIVHLHDWRFLIDGRKSKAVSRLKCHRCFIEGSMQYGSTYIARDKPTDKNFDCHEPLKKIGLPMQKRGVTMPKIRPF